jgi:hypothetical protein
VFAFSLRGFKTPRRSLLYSESVPLSPTLTMPDYLHCLPLAGYSETNFWPQSIKLNDETLNRVYAEIENGTTLELEMDLAPSQ